MGREKDGYRENLELLNSRFSDMYILRRTHVMQVIGCKDVRTLFKNIPDGWTNQGIMKDHVARYMCGDSSKSKPDACRYPNAYYKNLDRLNKLFPSTDMLNKKQVAKAIGCTDRRTVKKSIPYNWAGNRISKVYVARYMCG